jgi:hypothetical protein
LANELPATVDLTAYRGDTWAQTFRFLTDVDAPLDLTGADVAAWARSDYPKTVEHLLVSVDDPTTGVVTIALPQNGASAAASYEYDVEVTGSDGTVTTWVRGKLTVEQDVTNAD